MKKMSSDTIMETYFEKLATIKKVQVPEGLFDKINNRIATEKPKVVPLWFMRVAAALILCLLSVDAIVIVSKSKGRASSGSEILAPVQNNMLYHD